jgi:hypothetical protein
MQRAVFVTHTESVVIQNTHTAFVCRRLHINSLAPFSRAFFARFVHFKIEIHSMCRVKNQYEIVYSRELIFCVAFLLISTVGSESVFSVKLNNKNIFIG